ncbi:hypothetical protein EMCG_06073 [[Emmonsia] crescens]|uniref:Uncharacterized protein n=1 Tax=[Emmonsia] crescens TaxID=73230 RepID=A0A0G2ID80_9EURO|nr:hypothetical protein EMCG_06073 [Emmonsia crescens UAMH 3008]
MQYHVKITIQPGFDGQPWMFEESRLDESSTRFRLLVRVLIAKIADPVKLLVPSKRSFDPEHT